MINNKLNSTVKTTVSVCIQIIPPVVRFDVLTAASILMEYDHPDDGGRKRL
jgi:hypothetical protein